MTYLYSCFIGSFLVAPSPHQYLKDVEELFKKDYKLFLGIWPGVSEEEAKDAYLSILIGPIDYNSPYVRHRHKYLLKLRENAKVLSASNNADLLTSAVGHGKGCIVEDMPFETFHYVVANIFSGYGGVLLKEKLGYFTDQWQYAGTYHTILRKGLSKFFAAGILKVYESGRDLANLYNVKMFFQFSMRRNNPYYTEGVFFHIGDEKSLYIFTLKNEQGRLVFYIWAGLIALAFVPFLVVNRKRIWRAFRTCTKRALTIV